MGELSVTQRTQPRRHGSVPVHKDDAILRQRIADERQRHREDVLQSSVRVVVKLDVAVREVLKVDGIKREAQVLVLA